MEKYRASAEKVLKGIHPDLQAKEALLKATFASQQREEFFNEAYGDILTQYFTSWLSTDPHEVKTREFIYNSALSLGDVKQKLINFETYGKNIPYIEDNEQ